MSEPTPAEPVPTPPTPKRRGWPWIVGIVAVLLSFGLGLGIGLSAVDESVTADSPVATAEPADDEPAPKPKSEPAPEPEFYEPTVADYVLTIKELEKQCFGSAGCNISFRVEVTTLYTETVDPNATYELTYEVQGGDDPLLNTLTLTGDQYETDESEFIGTASSDAKLTAVVTSVSKRGL